MDNADLITEGVAAQLYWIAGGGFYWSVVSEKVREEWREEARKRLSLPKDDPDRVAGGGGLIDRSLVAAREAQGEAS
ncbi:hypothetical protein ACJ41P_10250 [Azospirillum argentinense]|uniref:Uncharacterized protein n=1 Tax=Azospirillum argentinense TaxID=2970906 RepID=A0ABW8V800_9PROT